MVAGDGSASLALPVALSAPPRAAPLQVSYTVQTEGGLQTDLHVVVTPAAPLVLPAGDFDDTLYLELRPPLPPGGRLVLTLTGTSDPALHLGFPGPAARGRQFSLIVAP